ncbi:MAG: hypothetical protein WDN69_26535 [Aliidongia sp.]
MVTPWGGTDGAYSAVCEPLGPIVINPLDATIFYTGGGAVSLSAPIPARKSSR